MAWSPACKALSLTVLPSIRYLPNATEVWVSLMWWSLTGSGCLRVLWGEKKILVLLESCLLTKAHQRSWNLIKINLIVVISIIYFYPYVKQGCVLYFFKTLKTITWDNEHMNIHIFINSRTIIIYRGFF